MDIITGLTSALSATGLPMAVGSYDTDELDDYIVIMPGEEFVEDIADNKAITETTSADISLFQRGDYQANKNQIKTLLETAGYLITFCGYIGYEKTTKHHHYLITAESKEVLP